MESRVVLDAFFPSPSEYIREAKRTSTSSVATLRQSLKANFPSPAPAPPVNTHNLIRVTSLPELQRAILHARAHHTKVRASTGGLKSSSNRAFLAAGGIVIDTCALSKLVFHANRAVVVAQAAVSLRDLDAAAHAYNFSQRVHVPLSSSARSIGAAVACGAMGGAGACEGLLMDVVEEVSFVDAFGRLRVYSSKDRTGLFKAVKLSLGLFGVIYDVTLKVDLFRRVANVTNQFVPLAAFLHTHAMHRLVERWSAVEFTWIPFSSYRGRDVKWKAGEDAVWVRGVKRVVERGGRVNLDDDEDVAFRFLTIPQWISLNAVQLAKEGYGEYRAEDCRLFQGLSFQQTAWKVEGGGGVRHVAHAVQYQDNADMFPVVSAGVAFGVGSKVEDWQVVREAWRVAVEKVVEGEREGRFELNVGMKMKIVKPSDALLAANFRDGKRILYSACLHVISAKHTLSWKEFAGDVVRQWMRLGGRAVLSREVAEVCDAKVVEESLGENLSTFKALRRNAGVDDVGMFLSEPYAELLGMADWMGKESGSPVSSAEGDVWAEEASMRGSARIGRSIFGSLGPGEGGLLSRYDSDGVGRSADSLMDHSWPCTPPAIPVRVSESFHEGAGAQGRVVGDSSDDESLDSVSDEMAFRRTYSKRLQRQAKLAAHHHVTLSRPECGLLIAYVVVYVLLWLALFGKQAAQRLGWMA